MSSKIEHPEVHWKESFEKSALRSDLDYQMSQWTSHGLRKRISFCTRMLDRIQTPNSSNLALDVGSGPGTLSSVLAQRGFRVIAIDYSENMIKKAKHKISSESDGQTHIEVIVADARHLPIRDNLVDLILCFGVFQYVGSDGQLLGEFVRLLKPNSYCLINAPNARFIMKRKDPYFKWYDPSGFAKQCLHSGFSQFHLMPLLLFPLLLRPFEILDRTEIFKRDLWRLAHDFVIMLRK